MVVAPSRARRSTAAACALAVGSALLAGCGTVRDFFGDPAVFESTVEPVTLDVTAPAYAAAVPGGLLVRHGDDEVVLPSAAGDAAWLPGGRVLLSTFGLVRVVDPETGPVARLRAFSDPVRSVTRVDLVRGYEQQRLTSYDLELKPLGERRLPSTDSRGFVGPVATLGGVTWVPWREGDRDGIDDGQDGDHGVLRIEGGERTDVLVNARVVELFVTPDGAALLALRQTSGDPCGGCVVPQDVVEIDPATGEVVREYGMPEDYDESWRVLAMDKVGDRVAVQFYEQRRDDGFPQDVPTGTWVFDGSWELLEGSEQVTTWWQGPDDRIEARPVDEPARRDGYQLVWVREDDEVELPGELVWARGRTSGTGAVAGRLLPPD